MKAPHIAVMLVAAISLSGCLWHHKPEPRNELVLSPDGQPLTGGPLGYATCTQAIGKWFDSRDTAHRGWLSLEDWTANARRQFTTMDIDHSGLLTPEELSRYRAPYLTASRDRDGSPAQDDGDDDDKGDSRIREDLPDPVMAADLQMHNQVDQNAFLASLHDSFARLDKDHNGQLDRTELLGYCPKY